MSKNNSSRGFAVGSAVVLTAEFAELEGRDALYIYEIVDARLCGREYTYVVAPVTDVGPDMSQKLGAFASDLREVGR